MPNVNLNNVQGNKTQTLAQWALDATVYTKGWILIASDEVQSQGKRIPFKIANGVNTWSALPYILSKDEYEAIEYTLSPSQANPFATIGDLANYEASSNKTDTVAGNEASTTLYLSVKGYYDYLVGLVWLTAQLFGTWISGLVSKATPVDADIIPLMDSADTNKTKGLSWANFKATLKTYFDTLYAPASQLDTFTIPFSSLNFNPADSTTYYFAGANALAPAATDTNYDSNFGYAFVIIGCTIGCYGNATQGSNENSVLQFRNVTQGTSTVIGNFTSDGTATMIQYTTMTGLNISVAATDWGCIQWDTPVWATNPGSVRTTGFLICKRV